MKLNEIADQWTEERVKEWVFNNFDNCGATGKELASLEVTKVPEGFDINWDISFFCLKYKNTDIPFTINKILKRGNLSSFKVAGNLSSAKYFPKRCEAIDISGGKFTSLEGMPTLECTDLFISTHGTLNTVESIFPHISCDLNRIIFGSENFTSLVGIGSATKHSIRSLVMQRMKIIKTGGLGVMLIPGIKTAICSYPDSSTSIAFGIIQKWINKLQQDENAIFMCQDELIKRGFDRYAEV